MDKAERSRLRCLLIAESQHRVGSRIALYRGAAKALPSLIDALDAATAERDAALKQFAASVPLHLYYAALRRWEVAEAERDAARAEAARYRAALLEIEDTIENARFEMRSGHVFDTDEFILGSVRDALAAADMVPDVTAAKEER